jgi:hypothetical protein
VIGAVPIVHTTGINWDSILAIGSELVVILGVFGAILRRVFRQSVHDEIDSVVGPLLKKINEQLDSLTDRLDLHDIQIAHLQGVEEGKRQAIGQAGLTSGTAEKTP